MSVRCMAITAGGKRCSRSGARWTCPVMFAHDPITGRGESGPDLCFCHQHGVLALDLKEAERVPVVDGFYGRAFNPTAKVWTVVMTVLERADDSAFMSKKWLRFRKPTTFGDCQRRENYDEARRAA